LSFALGKDRAWCIDVALKRVLEIPLATRLGHELWRMPSSSPPDAYLESLVRSSDGSLLAVGTALATREIYVLDARTGEAHAVPAARGHPIGFDRSGARILFVSNTDLALSSSKLDGSDLRRERPGDSFFVALAGDFVLSEGMGNLKAARMGSAEPWIDLGDLSASNGFGYGSANAGTWAP
jgi:hypothetical protein